MGHGQIVLALFFVQLLQSARGDQFKPQTNDNQRVVENMGEPRLEERFKVRSSRVASFECSRGMYLLSNGGMIQNGSQVFQWSIWYVHEIGECSDALWIHVGLQNESHHFHHVPIERRAIQRAFQ